MANNLPRIPVNDNWLDLNTASGISVGTALKIQNTGGSSVNIVLASSEPTIDIGEVIEPRKFVGVVAGEAGTVWAKTVTRGGGANLSVQDNT